MTRACPAYENGSSSRSVKYSSSTHLRSLSGGVGKSYRPSSPGRSFKMYTKAQSTAQCLQILKSLLPNARHQTESTELELVRETIAYITHLENILRPPPAAEEEEATAEDQMQPSAVAAATAMLQEMRV
ncbi:hypothetical protein GBAR_LOCUS5937 [Geodia barretti]|uniref:BHLH domain-containing protein n=1 Tax=Geodia barretti TaxID=519541 RepID=A0AA35RC19_GEOBA|nr:hypothetical protein GBAR_LOCUS5937 [Geodia barretti]